MHPPVDQRAIAIVRETVPEFENHYLDLLDIYGEDLIPQVIFNELADFVTDLLQADDDDATLDRCFDALERVALEPTVDGTELVAFNFLLLLPPFAIEMASDYMGPATEVLWDLLERDLIDDDGELRDEEDYETALLLSDRTVATAEEAPIDGI